MALEPAGVVIETDIGITGLVAFLAIVKAGSWLALRVLRFELEARRENLCYQQAGGDRLQRVIDRLIDGFIGGIGLGDQIAEAVFATARST